ncbi:hypothetical protein OG426_55335 (plasmid) [Streptomyces canus]|uniref:hypothetical protein n=1 Tax=Streptomyces canus TaxID=58343 RepID=UPI003867BB7E|nr:hypothetical protein OG426_55335 [Streptomyces canus]
MAAAVQDVLKGSSRLVVLIGSSSTGKTRACWEAVQPLADHGWHLWHPFDPTRAEAALADLERVQPYTVVWLNEAQHYLGDTLVGERVAAAVHNLLTHARRPVLVLGTLWPEYAAAYTHRPDADAPDPHSRVRELLAGRTVTVPDTFDEEALSKAAALAGSGDQSLADALTRARRDGRVTQDLAGAPELLRRYELSTPPAKAVLEAAMDARRLGVGLHLPQPFLTDAAIDYLTDHDYDQLSQDWVEAAFAELARPVHGKQAALRRTGTRPKRHPPGSRNPNAADVPASGPVYRLADYLEQHGRRTRGEICPPASFWYAAHSHLAQPEDLSNLARAATARHRLQWGHHLQIRAAEAGDPACMHALMQAREQAGDRAAAEELAWRAAEAGHIYLLVDLAWMREEERDGHGVQAIVQPAADRHPGVLMGLGQKREETGDLEGAEELYRQVVQAGHLEALPGLARLREVDGDPQESEEFALKAAEAGLSDTLIDLARIRELHGDLNQAETLYLQAVRAGRTRALADLALVREQAGDPKGAEEMARAAARAGITTALADLARHREEAGDEVGAEAMAQEASAAGVHDALSLLASMREHQGKLERAETLYRMAAESGHTIAFVDLARLRRQTGDLDGADAHYQQAVEAGHIGALVDQSQLREQREDRTAAEKLAHRAAEAGYPSALTQLARLREGKHDLEGAKALYRQAADAGDHQALIHLSRLLERAGDRYGAEETAQQSADAGQAERLTEMARTHELEGGADPAETLYRQAAAAGDKDAAEGLARLVVEASGGHFREPPLTSWREQLESREQAGDKVGVDQLCRQAADAGEIWRVPNPYARWPHGLDPDGTPASPWK